MFERYTLSCTYFPSQSFDENGCDYLVFPMPGKKEHVTVDIYYSLEDRKGIHTEEINLLEFKSGTAFQVGIQSSNSLIKLTQKLLVRASTSTLKSSTLIRRQMTSSYETYTKTLTTQTTSAIIEIKTDKSLQFQANWLNIARVTSITT